MWNSRIFLAYWQPFWALSLLLLKCVHLGISAVLSDHSTFTFSGLQCFWGSWSHHQAHSCCTAKAPAPTIKPLYKFLLLFKQSSQNNLGVQIVFHMSDLVLCDKRLSPAPHRGARRHDSTWGDPNNLTGDTSPSLPLAGLSQGTLSPMGQGWHPSGWDNGRGSPKHLTDWGELAHHGT